MKPSEGELLISAAKCFQAIHQSLRVSGADAQGKDRGQSVSQSDKQEDLLPPPISSCHLLAGLK